MTADQQVYSDEEFALVLRKAAELANRSEPSGSSSAGLTLAEMKAAAAQAGLDPALIERAARLVVASANASPFERLIGGPFRHGHEARFPVTLDEHTAARLLSAVRIIAGQAGNRDAGHSSAAGMTWHDGGEMEALGVTARAVENGASVSVVLDRRGTLALVALSSGLTMFFAVLFAAFALYPEAPVLGYAGLMAGIGGPLAVARAYWASSTRKVRERMSAVLDTIGEALAQPESQASGSRAVGDGAAAPEAGTSAVGNAELSGM